MKKFTLKPKVIFDNNSLTYIRTMNEGRFFIIADPFLLENKMINKVLDELLEREYKIYSDIIFWLLEKLGILSWISLKRLRFMFFSQAPRLRRSRYAAKAYIIILYL